jgi:uncharacterized membrane protein
VKKLAIAYVATLLAFLVLDALWLSAMSERIYRPAMGDMLLDGFRPAPALLFYLIYVAALVYFGVRPGLTEGAAATLINSALFGLAAYATYDLTNQATLKNWSTQLTLADLSWGATVSALAASIGRVVAIWAAGR